MKMRILVTGGGVSGGHSASIVAIVHEFRSRSDQWEFYWIGSKRGRERVQASSLGIPFVAVPVGKLRRYVSVRNVVDVIKIPFGVIMSLFVVVRFRPDVVFAAGGYVSVPASIAAWMLRKPVVIHENDVAPGLANRILARVSTKVFVSAKETAALFSGQDVVHTGIPLRKDIMDGDAARGRSAFGFSADVPVLLVIGGGQGAQSMNEAVIEAREELEQICQVIHIAGEAHVDNVRSRTGNDSSRYVLLDYGREQLRDLYAMADVVLTRGGAHALNEIAYYGIPSIVVPMERYSSGHQGVNARRIADHGAGIMIHDSNLTGRILLDTMKMMLRDRKQLAQMSAQVRSLFQPDAASRIVSGLIDIMKSS
jgi:UDP-N-acetylglucosamine--N-acetylmuramyl-(pentapeptide) pyrophosphoryl-undecaprenol N-acetylglucosamine transferase